jgi:TolB-like protein
MSGLYQELKRRNVFRVGAAYLLASWLLLQIVDVVGPILRLPDDFARYLLFLLIVGLLPALAFAWVFEWTPEGVKRDSEIDHSPSAARQTGGTLDRAIIVILALAVGLLLFDRLVLNVEKVPDTIPLTAGAAPNDPAAGKLDPAPFAAPNAGKSVAVLPFVAMSNGPDDDYFADGLSEEIINALAQAPDLLVTARTSAFHFKGRNLPIAEIAAELGVAHVLEGSVRRAGEQLRITAQLVRAEDGFHLWSETYDRRNEDSFAVQTDIAEKVASALNVYLDDALRERMRWVGTRNVEAFIAFQKGIGWYERAHQEANQIGLLRQANVHFEQAITQEPGLIDAYQYHADLYSHMLITQAAGQLDGEITDADLARAPAALAQDYERAASNSRTPVQRGNAAFDSSLLFGHWRGLDVLGLQNAGLPGCEPALWLHLAAPLSSEPEVLLDAFRQMAACDPLRTRPMVHQVGIGLWLGRTDEALGHARTSLAKAEHPSLSRHLTLALAFKGETREALATANAVIRNEDDLLPVLSMLAAIRGDAEAARQYQDGYLAKYGPNDMAALVLEAVRGNRGEANRLAAGIDARPFGHVVLLQAVYDCLCGAPFDLDATPAFAGLLAESGFAWPPARPFDFPLKDW